MTYKEILQINKEEYGQLNFQKLDPKKSEQAFCAKKKEISNCLIGIWKDVQHYSS